MNWFAMILKLIQLAPSILKLITDVETIVGSGNGAVKKAIVMAPLAGASPELTTAASNMVDSIVASQKSVIPVANPARPTLNK